MNYIFSKIGNVEIVCFFYLLQIKFMFFSDELAH